MGALQGKVAVITGSTSGIGARTAELFVAEGARVVIAGRREEKGRRLARALGEAARFIRTDVSNEAEVEAMIAHAVKTFGRLDCLMNNAGSGSGYQEIANVDLKKFDETIAVHVRGALAGMKYAVPVMAEQKSGSIINVASVNGARAGLGGHYYSAAKAALIHLTRCAAVELGEKGIRVNSISPGPIATGAFGKSTGFEPDDTEKAVELAKAAIAAVVLPQYQPLPYVGTVDDIAQAALFLASDASKLVSGVDLVVDGGISAGWPIAAVRDDRVRFFEMFRTSEVKQEGHKASSAD
ncbi:MAG TPA: glucose 1-dehydrogenase [Candidatus Acidoferrales bacterium]|nr:glucose 1-dehydrogenase [Candidatus Acidoferrales bacterium]